MQRLALFILACLFCGFVGCDWFASSDPLAPNAAQVRNLLLDPEDEENASDISANTTDDAPLPPISLRIGVVGDTALYHQLAPLGDAMGMSLSNIVFESETTAQRDRGNRSIRVSFVEAILTDSISSAAKTASSTADTVPSAAESKDVATLIDAKSCDLVILPTSQLDRIGDASVPFPAYFTGDLREFEAFLPSQMGGASGAISTSNASDTPRGGAADLQRMTEVFHQLQTQWTDLFPLMQSKQTRWGTHRVAMPLGVAMPILCLRSDLLPSSSRNMGSSGETSTTQALPQTWTQFMSWIASVRSEFQEVASASSVVPPDSGSSASVPLDQTSKPIGATPEFMLLEPMAGHAAAESLFTRAAPYLVHRSQFSTFFQLDTMEPTLGEPAMRRALAEMVQQYAEYTPEQRDFVCSATPQMVSDALRTGRTLAAILSPTAAHATEKNETQETTSIPILFGPAPGSDEVFNPTSQTWERRGERESKQIPYLADGRVIVVTTTCATPRIAQRLAMDISSARANRPLLASSESTGPFRFTDETFAFSWSESWIPPYAMTKRIHVVRRLASEEYGLQFPSIEGRDAYLAALSDEIRAAIRGEKTSDAALDAAILKWNEITEQYGRAAQKTVYRKSLGL